MFCDFSSPTTIRLRAIEDCYYFRKTCVNLLKNNSCGFLFNTVHYMTTYVFMFTHILFQLCTMW